MPITLVSRAGGATVPELVSRPANEQLTEFSSDFDTAFVAGEEESWSTRLGLVVNSRFKRIIPIPVDAPSIKRAIGDPKFRDLFVGELEFSPDKYFDGIQELVDIIEADGFSGWANAPGNMAREFRRYPNKLVAALLEANGNLDFYKIKRDGGDTASTIALFASTHPVNLAKSGLGTQSNVIDQGTHTDFDETLMIAVERHFAEWKAANGEKMGMRPRYVLVPTGRAHAARKYFARDTVIEEGTAGVIAAPNIFQGTVEVIQVDHLTDADYVYFVAAEMSPWVVQTPGAPDEKRLDSNSEWSRLNGKVAIWYEQIFGVAGLLPHGIFRVDLKSEPRA